MCGPRKLAGMEKSISVRLEQKTSEEQDAEDDQDRNYDNFDQAHNASPTESGSIYARFYWPNSEAVNEFVVNKLLTKFMDQHTENCSRGRAPSSTSLNVRKIEMCNSPASPGPFRAQIP
jgi:hypothetical protein